MKNEAKCHGPTPLEKIKFDDYVINICFQKSYDIKKRSRLERSKQRQRTCWNAKKVLTFLLSVLTSDWLKQQKLTKLHKAVHILILTFQPSSL